MRDGVSEKSVIRRRVLALFACAMGTVSDALAPVLRDLPGLLVWAMMISCV